MSAISLLVQCISNVSIVRFVQLLLFLKFIQILWKRRRIYFVSWQLPGPFAVPFLGNLYQMRNKDKLYDSLQNLSRTFGSLYRLWLGPILVVFVYDARDIQAVTTSPNALQKPVGYQFAKMWMGNGIFTAPYRIWHTQRKKIENTFTAAAIDSYMNVFNWESNILVDQLRQHENTNKYFNMFDFTCRCTLDIVGQTMLGYKFNCQIKNEETNSYDNEYMKATAAVFTVIHNRSMQPWLTSDFIFRRTKDYQIMKKCSGIFDHVTDAVIKSRNNREPFLAMNDLTGQKTMIDELFKKENSNKLTNELLKDHLNTMVATGADATGNALAILFVLLAMHPDIQEKLYQEIKTTLDANDTDLVITRNSIGKMTYLDYTIKESLRLFPGTSMIARITTGDVQLKSRNITLPKGTVVAISAKELHTNKEFWGDNVEVFDPDRFATQHKRHPYCFAPFSAGPRNCVGYKYALLSMKVITIQTLRAYRLVTEEKFENFECVFKIMLKKKGGCNLKLVTR